MMGGMGIWMFLLPLLACFAVAALLAVGVLGTRMLASEDADPAADVDADPAADADPIERLKRRYTEGELTETEFERALERELDAEGDDTAASRSTDWKSETADPVRAP